MDVVDLIGYLASLFVLLSFLMKKMNHLRFVNLIGCSFFILYGFLLPGISWPIVITNLAIVAINSYYLILAKKN